LTVKVPDEVNTWYLYPLDVEVDPPDAAINDSLDLPYPSDISIAPEEVPNKPRTAELPMLIAAVAVKSSSTLTCRRDIGLPADGNVMLYLAFKSSISAFNSLIASIK